MSKLIPWTTWVQRYVGKTIFAIRFHEQANMLELDFTDGSPTLGLPLAGRRRSPLRPRNAIHINRVWFPLPRSEHSPIDGIGWRLLR